MNLTRNLPYGDHDKLVDCSVPTGTIEMNVPAESELGTDDRIVRRPTIATAVASLAGTSFGHPSGLLDG